MGRTSANLEALARSGGWGLRLCGECHEPGWQSFADLAPAWTRSSGSLTRCWKSYGLLRPSAIRCDVAIVQRRT